MTGLRHLRFRTAVLLSCAFAPGAAGMRYVVFTAKHHGGFCMWDTKLAGEELFRLRRLILEGVTP